MIKTKEDFYKLWNENKLGNRPRTFNSYAEAYDFPTSNTLSIRYKVPGSDFSRFEMSKAQLKETYSDLIDKGARPDLMTFSEDFAAGAYRLINADVWRSPRGLYMNYSHKSMVLRHALNIDSNHAENTKAIILLKQCLDIVSYEFLEYLLDEYPDHVVELSSWDMGVGIFNWNTIFWEVRAF